MTTLRIDIERALDELISNEEGMRFQGLAVVLAKQRWPELIASERKWDLGLDAYSPASLARDGIGKGLACTITPTLKKIKEDVNRFKKFKDDVKVLLFATPLKVTSHTAIQWADEIREEYGIELVVLSREDIITDLLRPINASLCHTHLGIFIPIEATVTESFFKAKEAAAEVVATWLAHPRLVGKPKISLIAVILDQCGRDTDEVFDLGSARKALLESRRAVLEAPAGRGKTTMLVQLAELLREQGDLAFLIDLPEWVLSKFDILEFIATKPQFRSRGIHPEMLARLYKSVPCSFLINGWNEISDRYSDKAVSLLASLERDFPKAGIIIATRPHHIRPPLPGSFRARLLSLNRQQRKAYLQQALSTRAEELGELLDRDRVLDDLTRTPFFLAEVTTIFSSGGAIPKTKLGILDAVVRLVEQTDEHRSHLQQTPLMGFSRDYLTELAIHMTIEGSVTLTEEQARTAVSAVSRRLKDAEQIAILPEYASILNALSSHHVLERMEYPSIGFRFEHQQLQEFYAAEHLKRRLWALVDNEDSDESRHLTKEYLNWPVWEEPIRMIAEEIGERCIETNGSEDSIKAGKQLIELTLFIDPVFAAQLARLCGHVVWQQVQTSVGQSLRSWYRIGDDHHRRCALAGMLASGSEDFLDILLPLFTNDDQQIRLGAYRAGGEFHLSSLGTNWRHVVEGWKEQCRAEFIVEVVRDNRSADIAEEFAKIDLSLSVRVAALHALDWVDAEEAIGRVLDTYDEDVLERIISDNVFPRILPRLRPRVLAIYGKLLQKEKDSPSRLRILFAAEKVTGDSIQGALKDELSHWPLEKIRDTDRELVKLALESVRKIDPHWVNQWVSERIISALLRIDYWSSFISEIPEDTRQQLLERLGSEDLKYGSHEIIEILKLKADENLAKNVFTRLCNLYETKARRSTSSDASEWAIIRQLEDLFRSMPPTAAISGILGCLSPGINEIEYKVVLNLFARFDTEDTDLRSQLPNDLRQAFRVCLKQAVPFVLSQDDFNGELKVHLALAIAWVGDPADITDLYQLIRADIDRVRRGRAARLSRERSPLADGAVMAYSNWHVQALITLDSRGAEKILLEVLCEPEYEHDAAKALIQLARIQREEMHLNFKKTDYRVVWEARSGKPVSGFNEDRRLRYKEAIRRRISVLSELRNQSSEPDSFNGRLKELACAVAVLDGRESAELVLAIMALPGKYDGWDRVNAIETLLFSGARLPAEATLSVLNPLIDHTLETFYHQQTIYLLGRCLCLLPFLDPPSTGISRIKEVISARIIPTHELRGIISALGCSRCNDALDLLLEIVTVAGNNWPRIASEWIDGIAAIGTPKSKQVLMSFVDPDVTHYAIEQYIKDYNRKHLASCIIDIARTEQTVLDRLFHLCDKQLPSPMRNTLAEVVAQLGSSNALVVGLSLIHDQAEPPIPRNLISGLQSVFLERRPYGNTGYTYTLEPRSANEIRLRLFRMVSEDGARKRSAWVLIGLTESWRLEHGRPSNEPRHPAFDSGKPWPPIAQVR